MSAGEISKWCTERTEIPNDEDEPFALDHLISAESLNIDEQDLKIVISTKRLLRNLKKSVMVQIEAKYKLIWQGYPVMVLGTSDKDQVFHISFIITGINFPRIEEFGAVFQVVEKTQRLCVKLKLDIHYLQTCPDESSFLMATELFFIKWRGLHDRKVNEFLQYFEHHWILKQSCWYEGAAPGYPSTNNEH